MRAFFYFSVTAQGMCLLLCYGTRECAYYFMHDFCLKRLSLIIERGNRIPSVECFVDANTIQSVRWEESRGKRRRCSTDSRYFVRRRGGVCFFGSKVPKERPRACVAEDRGFSPCEEITQDTFLRAYRISQTLKNRNQFAGWLYVIANRLCINWHRKQKPKMQSLEDTPVADIEKSSHTHHVLEQREKENTQPSP